MEIKIEIKKEDTINIEKINKQVIIIKNKENIFL